MTDETPTDGSWPHVLHLPVLGVWIRFASDSKEVILRVRQRYGGWAGLKGKAELLTDSPCAVNVSLEEDLRASHSWDEAPRYHHRLPDRSRLLVTTDGGVGVADTRRAESIAYVDRRLLLWPPEFAHGMLDPLTLFLLGDRDRQPLHATAIERGGIAILLAGPSGSGKSSIAYAAMRNGFRILAEEPVYVQLEPRLRVWGRTSRIRLPPSAADHFPGLRNAAAIPLPNGKSKILVGSEGGPPRYAETAGLCVLRKGAGGAPGLQRASPDEMVEILTSRLDPGFDLYADTIGECIRRVAERGAWHLSVTDSPTDVVPLLAEVEAVLGGRA